VRSRAAADDLSTLRADRQIACTLTALYRAANHLAAAYDGLLYRDRYCDPTRVAEVERLEDDACGDVDCAIRAVEHLGAQLREHADLLEGEAARSAAASRSASTSAAAAPHRTRGAPAAAPNASEAPARRSR
jgi:hypothetical protein